MKNNSEKTATAPNKIKRGDKAIKRLGGFLKYNWFFIIAGVVIAILFWLALGYSI